MAGRNSEDKIRCSFCGKSQDQVRKLIAGPNGAYICDECVDICAEIIEEEFEDEEISGKGYMSAFLTGALGGLFASHCAIPVMVARLALVAELGKNAWWGILVMVRYALGHSILLIAAGTGYSYVEKIIQNPKSESVGKGLQAILGAVIFLVGLLLAIYPP